MRSKRPVVLDPSTSITKTATQKSRRNGHGEASSAPSDQNLSSPVEILVPQKQTDPSALLTRIATGKTTREYRDKQAIFSQGDAADAVFYIQTGKVKLTVVSKRGKEAVIAILQEGSFFGEGCLTRHGYNKKLELIEPLIVPADRERALFSFYNLSEAHILSVTTRSHKVKLAKIRAAMNELRALALSNPQHPLLSREFYTDGRDLFIKTFENTINLSRFGQLGLREILDSYLERIERDAAFNPTKLYPVHQSGKVVSMIPTVSSGRPVIDKYGIPVATIWNRYKAGDSEEYLAEDYEIPESQIKGAIGYVEQLRAA